MMEQLSYRSNQNKTQMASAKIYNSHQNILISSNFECIHATVIILTSSYRFLGSMNTMEQLSYRSNHKKQTGFLKNP